MPGTGETDVLLWPTPTRFDATCGDLKGKEYTGTKHAMKLIQAAKMFPTPTAHNAKEGNYPSEAQRNTPTLAAEAGGKLNPQWVEWLMGFPDGWTDLDA